MRKSAVIGIDTSNYTTSLAIVATDGELIANIKRPLQVNQGQRGLRQSDAVFSHVRNLPVIMDEVKRYSSSIEPVAVGVSVRPRNKDGSYMPCFLSGVSSAHSISACLGLPIYEYSHQCGHIMASLFSSGKFDLLESPFVAFHLSGGTSEMLRVKYSSGGFDAEIVGGTLDLNAGQVIDRIGVLMDMPFPAGKYIEESALMNKSAVKIKRPCINGTYFNLSGLENIAIKLYKETEDKEYVSAYVLEYVGRSVLGVCKNYCQQHGDLPFVFAGGVMSNSIIKNMLRTSLDAYFAEPALSADNAVGIAELARRDYFNQK